MSPRMWEPVVYTLAEEKRRIHSCEDKLAHPHVLSAMAHIQHLEAKNDDSRPLSWYVCQYCDRIHVGHERKQPNMILMPEGD
jgi:hypothetical protein